METIEKELICQECPNRCLLKVTGAGEQVAVAGNRCPRGERFGRAEFLGEKNTVQGFVKTVGAKEPRAAVTTDRPVPKGMVYKLILALKRLSVTAPMPKGGVVKENICSTGANIILTEAVPAQEEP